MASSKSGEGKGVRKLTTAPSSASSDVLRDAAIHPATLRAIVEILEASDITRLDWKRGDERLILRRGPELPHTQVMTHAPMVSHAPVLHAAAPAPSPSQPAAASAPRPEAKPESKPGTVVTSPFVGTFYRSPSPDAPSFVDVGSVVKKGQVLCIVEAMKLMNEIEAESNGKVAEILAQNGQTVEFGQPLFRIEPV